MHLRDLANVLPGHVLGRTVYTQRGDVLLAEGTTLSQAYIDGLHRRGYSHIYIQDGLSDDVKPQDIVAEEVRAKTAHHVSRMFDVVALSAGVTSRRTAGGKHAPDPARDLGDRELALPSEGMTMLEALYADVERIMSEILESNAVSSLETLKSHSDYTFQHSVEVAIVAILLGKHLGLPMAQIRELALGALLHDIGKVYVDEAILNKPDKLTTEEFDEIKKHPATGFELVRRLPLFSILPAHVAFQHHERQDGTGYPRGLVGNNRILRLEAERLQPSRILLIAEIAAVADVFCALASERPYKPSFPLDKTARILREMSGHHLNRDVVETLLRVVPTYAVGHWIEITTGTYRGWRGIVTHIDAAAMHFPQVRLHIDARGNQVDNPVELDLKINSDIRLKCLAPGENPLEQAGSRVAVGSR